MFDLRKTERQGFDNVELQIRQEVSLISSLVLQILLWVL